VKEEKIIRGENRIFGGVCSTLAKKYKTEPWILRIGLIIISIFFYYIIFVYLLALMNNDPANGGIAPVLLAFIGIPVGMVIGFSIARAIAEKKSLKEQNIVDR
jgi:phage shock protein PspC (stress-responsive transcriptional regulator)